MRGKVAALAAVDGELRALEEALGERRAITELREPGITACPRCGTLHGSDARFCPSCGLALTGARTIAADVGEGDHVGGRESWSPRTRPRPRRSPPPRTSASARLRRRASDGRDGADQPTAIVRPGPERREP